MRKAIIVLAIMIVGYSSGLLLEAVAEGNDSKIIKLAYTGTISEDWNPFFLDPELKKIQELRSTMGAEFFSIPKILDFGLLDGSSQEQSTIKTANVAFNIAVVEKEIDGKNTLQNVVDKCVFHAEETYAPMCVICKLTDMQGQIIGVGIVKEDRKYKASESIDIPITPVVPEPKDPGPDPDPDPECVECEKPDVFTVKYNGPDGAEVTISKKGKDPVLFGTFNDGDLIVVDAINDLGRSKVNSETTYSIVAGGVSSTISIHTSCSQFPPTPHIGQEFFANNIQLTVVSGTLKGEPSIPSDASCPAPDKDDDDGKHDNDKYDSKYQSKYHYKSYDKDDLRKYFDNKYFNDRFSKADFKKWFKDSEFTKYSNHMSYAYNDKHDDDDDKKHDDDDNGKPNGEDNGNIEHVFTIAENPVDVQDVNGVKLIICEPPSKCVPVWADFKDLKHGSRQDAINAQFASSGITVSAIKKSGEDTEVIIFDADKTGTPDPDLQVNNGLHLLILPEDGTLVDANNDDLIDNPNDSAAGGTIIFKADFPRFVTSFDFVDHDNNKKAEARFYDDKFNGNLLKTVQIPNKGDGSIQTIKVNVGNVQRVEIEYHDSGGVTNIHFLCKPPKDGQGCTPGFWKQKQHFKFWVDYETDDKFGDVFGITSNIKIKTGNQEIKLKDATLLQALKAQGGGVNALARHGVAALLNAASLNYAFSVSEVIDKVKDAIQSGNPQKIESTKNMLAEENERGCPFGNGDDDDKCDCEERKDKHKKYYDRQKQYFDYNKKHFGKGDFKKYMNNFGKYFDENKKYFDKDDYKKYMDFYDDILDDNKRSFDKKDYKKFSNIYKKYSSEYKKSDWKDDRCECDKHDDDDRKYISYDDDRKHDKSNDECSGYKNIQFKYNGYYSPVKIEVSKDGKHYKSFSKVRNTDTIKLDSKRGDYLNDEIQFNIFRGKYLVDKIQVDATCSELKDKGHYYKGNKGLKLMIKNYKEMEN